MRKILALVTIALALMVTQTYAQTNTPIYAAQASQKWVSNQLGTALADRPTYTETTGIVDSAIALIPTPDLSGYVPYLGATADLHLGNHNLRADTVLVGGATDNGVQQVQVSGAMIAERLYIPNSVLGNRNGGFGFDSVGNPILEIGLNAGQFNTDSTPVDEGIAGTMFRLDTRDNFLFFKVMYKAPWWWEDEQKYRHAEHLCFGISQTLKTYVGDGWDEQEPTIVDSQTPADPNADLIVRRGISSGSDAAGGTLTLKAGSTPTPQAGMIYFDSGNSHFYGYDGSSWKQLDN